MTDPIGKEVIELVEQHLPDNSDPTVLVLKAHLLVEEQLVKLLREIAPQPESIENAKLSFPQKIQITQAFLPIAVPKKWFAAALLLNSIRNKLAHQLSPLDLQHLERDFTQLIFDASAGLSEFAILPGDTHQEKFKTALVMLIVGLSAARSALPAILAARKTLPPISAA